MNQPNRSRVAIPAEYEPYIAHAVARLNVLFPDAEIAITASKEIIEFLDSEANLEREIWNQLYRERIYAETRDIRRRLVGV